MENKRTRISSHQPPIDSVVELLKGGAGMYVDCEKAGPRRGFQKNAEQSYLLLRDDNVCGRGFLPLLPEVHGWLSPFSSFSLRQLPLETASLHHIDPVGGQPGKDGIDL